MRIGIFPGIFDPVHLGHIKALQTVAKEYSLQHIIIVPALCTPNKGLIKFSKSSDRWNILSAIRGDNLGFTISLLSNEINAKECSYTADTIELIHSKFPSDDLFLIIGEDHYYSLHNWYRFDFILNSVQLIIIKRSLQNPKVSNNGIPLDSALFSEPVSSVSSSFIREQCLYGHSLSDSVPVYCEDRLYAFGMYLPNNLRAKIDFVRTHQKASRFKHTIGVVKSAVAIASHFDIDTRLVVEAAFLHDIAKDIPIDLLRGLASNCHSDLGMTNISAVLHAPAGAELAKYLFSVEPCIYNAILNHCTLDTNMSLLDKIIYISDMVEPSRSYPAVVELRKRFYSVRNEQDLNALLVLAIEKNICYISHIGGVVHPASLRALSIVKL